MSVGVTVSPEAADAVAVIGRRLVPPVAAAQHEWWNYEMGRERRRDIAGVARSTMVT